MTTDYDRRLEAEFAILKRRVDRYFIELNTECPYGLPFTACFYQAMFGPLNDRVMELFLAAGYRRNGNCLYTMHCRSCQACIPIRLRVSEFHPNRNQRRVVKKNRDVQLGLSRVEMDKEHMELCGRFLAARYPQEQNTAEGYYGGFFCNSIVDSIRLDFRLDGRLIGGSVLDLGSNWMNAVYFYFDPDLHSRSLGTYNILSLIDMCRDHNIEYLYLGYYIEGISAMSYKRYFNPHELLLDGIWQQQS